MWSTKPRPSQVDRLGKRSTFRQDLADHELHQRPQTFILQICHRHLRGHRDGRLVADGRVGLVQEAAAHGKFVGVGSLPAAGNSTRWPTHGYNYSMGFYVTRSTSINWDTTRTLVKSKSIYCIGSQIWETYMFFHVMLFSSFFMILIWFDMIVRYGLDTLRNLGYDFDMFLLWFVCGLGYDFDVVLECCGYDFDMADMVWYGVGTEQPFQSSQWVGLEKKKQKQPRDRLLVDFSRVFVVLIWFWYGFLFDTILIRYVV